MTGTEHQRTIITVTWGKDSGTVAEAADVHKQRLQENERDVSHRLASKRFGTGRRATSAKGDKERTVILLPFWLRQWAWTILLLIFFLTLWKTTEFLP